MTATGPETIGPYTITDRLGRGTMGVVYRAVNSAGEQVALKVMLPDVASDEHGRARFVREARAVSRLRHRNIISVLDAGVYEGAPYIAMELLQGQTLEAHLANREALSLQTKLDIVVQLCEALQFAHDHGIVHRDVKPANISVLPDGRVKLFDFGVAKVTGATHTRIGDVVGSVAYMSPEQLAGDEVDGRTDVFSAGAILYELLSGRRPHDAEHLSAVMNKILHEDPPSLRELAPNVTSDIVLAVHTALQRDRSLRYAQASDFGTDLRLARYGIDQNPIEPTIVVREARRDREASQAPAAEASPAAPSTPVGAVSADAISFIEPTIVVPDLTISPAARNLEPPPIDLGSWSGGAETLTSRSTRTWVPALSPAVRNAVIGGALLAVLLALALALRTPSASEPASIALNVQSDPPGADVAFDGVDVGQKTPATVSLPSRPKQVRLTLPGFSPIESAVPEASGPEQTLSFRFQRVLHIRSDPPGARVLIGGVETGLVTPADMLVPDPVPDAIELVMPARGRRLVPITEAVLTSGQVRASFGGPGRDAGPTPGAIPNPGPGPIVAQGTAPLELPKAVAGTAPVLEPLTTTTVPTNTVAVRVLAGYPFEVTGCGHTGAAAPEHAFQVQAPCTLRLRASGYFLDVSRRIEATSGQVEIAAPQLARVQMRSRYEWCTLIINGRAVGSPPVDVDLVAGTYAATIQCPDKSFSIPAVAIEPGRYVRRLDELLR